MKFITDEHKRGYNEIKGFCLCLLLEIIGFTVVFCIIQLAFSWGAYSMYTHENIRWTHEISGLHGCIIGLGVEIFRMLSALLYWVGSIFIPIIAFVVLTFSLSTNRPILNLILFAFLFTVGALGTWSWWYIEVSKPPIDNTSWWTFLVSSTRRTGETASSVGLLISLFYLIKSIYYYFNDST